VSVEEADVVVVGAGVMGAAAAWRLTRAGRSVILLEQFEVGHDRGSSHGAVRVFRLSYDDAQYVRMAMEALPLWRELEEAAGVQLLTVTGGYDFGSTSALEAHTRALASARASFEMVTGKGVMARFPSISLPATDSVLFQRDAGVLSAERAIRAMVDLACAQGCVLHERSRVLGLRASDGLVDVETAESSFRAPVAVVTAGPWARPLLSGAGIDLPVTPSRESVAFYPSPYDAAFPVFVERNDHALYALPSPGQSLKTGWHHTGPDTDPDLRGAVEARVIDRMCSWVDERFPGAVSTPGRTETCVYTNTEDEHFILDRRGPVVFGSACSGHGFKFAPLIGERLVELAGLARGR
jgi:sarcosine oxidase